MATSTNAELVKMCSPRDPYPEGPLDVIKEGAYADLILVTDRVKNAACYIGKRRLERAIAAFGEPVKVHWQPFQLNPTMPKGGNHFCGKENN